ncbi:MULTISPECIES: hypothetical protein [Halomonadaceae]|uniref:Tyr recombinase domain-containing protein n=1 Tax=Vreelandella sp. SM1641 TaxID=3126101 RepID=A0AAU7XII0_9GAMM
MAWIARIALETGIRSSDILTLTRSQVDVKRRVVRLTDTKSNEAPGTADQGSNRGVQAGVAQPRAPARLQLGILR